MNKFLSIITISFLLSSFISIDSSYAFNIKNNISVIENNLYGFDYKNQPDYKRVERIEKFVYGESKQGDINNRIQNLSNDLSADVIGLEISPKKDTFMEEDSQIADETAQYPIVDEIETKLFNKTFRERDFHTRIVTIEKKMFGKVYDIDDYATRMDRIKSEILPDRFASNRFEHEYRDNKLSSDNLKGSFLNRFDMPFGQKNYTRPYTNYGDNEIGGAPPIDDYSSTSNLENELSQLEFETFGTEFNNEDSATRIKRLNSVNKAQKSSSKYDSQKFSQRMSTAMEIGAMILMILAMVL